MSEFGEQIIFKQLLDRHHTIRIPMIQRDFAQGRQAEKEIRDEFLDALLNALLLPVDSELLPLNLDFIYGSVEGNENKRFLPLDGQQRLTTMFLLHWYLAWKDGCQDKFHEMLWPKGESRFAYSVRPSSTDFFNELVKFRPSASVQDVSSLEALVTNQPWYFRYWRLDPTIQSCLTMLDSIHVRFRNTKGLYSRLVDEKQPAITFHLLDLENFGLSDDLYIKMNARGKPLTAFETFKARYEQELMNQFAGESRKIADQSFSVAEYFSRKMDTQWSDFFWSHRDKETNLYDEAVMNLFRLVALVTRDPECDQYLDDFALLRNKWRLPSYAVFHSEGWLDRNFSEHLFMLLEIWSGQEGKFSPHLPDKRFFDETTILAEVLKYPLSLGYTELVQFVGYIVFLRQHTADLDSHAFQEWMRVVFNLSVNTTYERAADMQRSIAAVLKLAPNSGRVLEYFATTEKPVSGFNLQQISEEKLKAELILADERWRTLIDRAESHGYFRGQIEFLFVFCGAKDIWTSSQGVDELESDEHLSLQINFQSYLDKAEKIFDARGLITLADYRWERALLSIGDYLLPSGGNYSFVVNSSTDQASWKRLLRGTGSEAQDAREIVHELLDILSDDEDLENQLDKIINGAKELEPWRKAFVDTPKAIKYCELKSIRWYGEYKIYLMKKSQMNGAHAELYTYCLYHNILKPMDIEGALAPIRLREYQSVNGSELQPYIPLVYKQGGKELEFQIIFVSGDFILFVSVDSLRELEYLQILLIDIANFQKNENYFFKKFSSAETRDILRKIVQALLTKND